MPVFWVFLALSSSGQGALVLILFVELRRWEPKAAVGYDVTSQLNKLVPALDLVDPVPPPNTH
jgi:hypothetical protein